MVTNIISPNLAIGFKRLVFACELND